ncbi:MAG: hypothetical protein MUC36_05270 [Planctomycetes bacterium]|jgi:hypothetical protein|nr:hypothetical protein [Planctomycetota bacterium]
MTDHREPGGRTPSPREPDERLADWVDGRMSERDRVRFTAELRVNAQLRADLAAYERTVAMMREALQAPTAPLPRRAAVGGTAAGAATTLADRVLAQVQGQAPVRSFRVAGGGIAWRPVLWSCASAAALLVLTLLLDSWSAEPVATSGTAVTKLDAASEPAVADGAAVALDQWVKPPAPIVLEQESAPATAATPKAQLVGEPSGAELAEEMVSTGRAANEVAGAAEPPAAEAMPGERARLALTPSRRDAVPTAPMTAPAPMPAAVPPPGSPRGDVPPPTEPSKEKLARAERSIGDDAGAPGAGGRGTDAEPLERGRPDGAVDRAVGSGGAPGAGAAALPPGDAGGNPVDKLGSAENFFLAGSRRAAPAPWSLLLVDGVQPAPAPVRAAGPGAASRGGPAGPSTGGPAGPSTAGPAGPAAPAAPAGGGPMPSPTELEQRLDAFLATAVQADAAPVLELPTARGTMRLWRLPLTALPKELAPLADDRQAGAPPLEASWAVEGPEADVAVLLQRVNWFVRQPELRTGETAAPKLPPAPPLPEASASPSAPTVVPAQRQLVLRFRLRPR